MMAFTTETERSAFFQRATERGVAPGTARHHVLGTNLGIWGNEHSLLVDAAKIMAFEIDTWAEAEGEDPLRVPHEIILQSGVFRREFDAWRNPNKIETDTLVRGVSVAARTLPTPAVRHEMPRDQFYLAIYGELARASERLHRARSDYDGEMERIGAPGLRLRPQNR